MFKNTERSSINEHAGEKNQVLKATHIKSLNRIEIKRDSPNIVNSS